MRHHVGICVHAIRDHAGITNVYALGSVKRKIGANGVGVERCFPLYSPYVDTIDVIAHAPFLKPAEREAILGGNLRKLLRING